MTFIPAVLAFPLVGGSFNILDAVQTGKSTVEVTFSEAPLASDSAGTNDVLNPENWTITGVALNAVQSVEYIGSDTVILTLFYPLKVGFWTVSGLPAIDSAASIPLGTPRSWTFYVASETVRENPEKGAQNDTAYDILRRFFNPALKGQNWDDLLHAFAAGEQTNFNNARYAYDQYFICSASGSYLTARGTDQGIVRPERVGLSDENFRKYAISLKNKRLTEDAILQILEVFYGVDAIHANLVSGQEEPYDIETGDEISFLVNGTQEVTVSFDASQFGIPHQAKALELAVQCNVVFEENGVHAYAVGYTDPTTGGTKLKIYSSAQGLLSSLECTGGIAQDSLEFDTLLDVYDTGSLPDWTITYDAGSRTTTFTATNPDPYPNVSLLQEGDYVNISGTEFAEDNRGSYPILHVGYSYSVADPPVLTASFEIDNENGVGETVTQGSTSSLRFYRPTKADTHTTLAQTVTVASIDGKIEVTIPATSLAISRAEGTGSYLHTPTTETVSYVASGGELTVDVPSLTPGSTVFLDPTPSFTAPSLTTESGKTSYSYLSAWTNTSLADGNRMGHTLVKMVSRALIFGGETPSPTFPVSYHTLAEIVNYSVGTVTASGVTYPQVTYSTSTSAQNGYSWAAGLSGTPDLVVYGYPQNTAFLFGGIAAATSVASDDFMFLDGTSFTLSGDAMTAARAFHRATPLTAHGHGFIAGGMTNWQVATNTTEVFDPAVAGTFAAKASMGTARAEHAQLALANNKVLVSGGRTMAKGPYVDGTTVALWRLDDSAAAPADSGPNALTLTGAVGSLVANQNANSKAAILWNGATTSVTRAATAALRTTFTSGAFTVEGWFKYAVYNTYPIFAYTGASTPAVAADNILFGFGVDPSTANNLIVYYDDSTTARVSLTVATASFGGLQSGWNHWAVTCQPGSVSGSKYILYINGSVASSWDNQVSTSGGTNATLSIGYEPNAGYVNQHWNGYQSQIKVSSVTKSAAEVWRSFLSGTGEAYYYKNATQPEARMGLALNSAEVYDPATNTWATTGSMAWTRFNHKLIELDSGEVLAIGGYGYQGSQLKLNATCKPVATAELWSPTTNRWRPAGNMPFGGFIWAEKLEDKILVGSGRSNETCYFDLKTYTWKSGLSQSTSFGSATHYEGAQSLSLDEGVVLTAGGWSMLDIGDSSTENEAIYVQNEDAWFGGNVGKMYTVLSSDVDGSTLKSDVVGYTTGTGTLTLAKAIAASHPKGPYLTDPVKGWAVTEVATTLATKLAAGHSYPFLDVGSTAGFTDGSYLVVGFGYEFQTNPIKILFVASDTQLAIDASYQFPEDIEIGSSVIQLYSAQPYIFPVATGQFYLTDSPSGRVAAQQAVEQSIAAGFPLNLKVQYPGDRGLGNEGYPTQGNYKLSDIVPVFAGSDDTDQEIQDERDRVNFDA